jgi:hypothetical protein
MLRLAGLALLVAFLVEPLVRGRLRSRAATASPRSPASRAGLALDIAVAAWTVTGIASTLAAVSPRLALLGEIEQREGLLTTLALAGLYAGTRRSHPDPGDTRRTLGVIVGCAALAAVHAILQLAGLDPLAWVNAPTYLLAPRVFGTLGNPILLGNLLAVALAAGVARLACGGGDALRLGSQVALIAGAAAATLSRGAWLAAAAGTGAALAGGLAAGGEKAARRVGLALAVVAAPVALWAVAMRAPLVARLSEAAQTESVSGPARAEIARGALALWRAHPWLGTGPDSFGLMFPSVQTAAFWRTEWLGLPVHAHSVALQVLATLGTAGALAGLAWLAALGWALAGARRSTAEFGVSVALGAATLALAVAGTVNPVGLAGAAGFAVLSALAAASGEHAAQPAGARTDAAPGREGAARFLALAAGLVTALAVALPGAREMSALAAAGGARSALEQATSARPEERGAYSEPAVRDAEQAAAMAGSEDELWRLACDAHLERAEVALAARDLAAARAAAAGAADAAGRALRLGPRRASNHERLGNALLMRARVAAALDPAAGAALADSADLAFGAALELAPADGLILTAEARGQLLLRRPEPALAAARRITALYPAAATGHALEAAALLALGRSPEARAALIRARDARWEDGAETQRRAVEDLLRAFARADSAR